MITTVNFKGVLNVTNIIPSFSNVNISWSESGFSPSSTLKIWTSTDGVSWTQGAVTTVGALNSIITLNSTSTVYISLNVVGDPVNGDYNDNHAIYSTVTLPQNSNPNVVMTYGVISGVHAKVNWTVSNLLPKDNLQVIFSFYLTKVTYNTTCDTSTITVPLPDNFNIVNDVDVNFVVSGKFTGSGNSRLKVLPSTGSIYINTLNKTPNSAYITWQNNGFQPSTPLQILIGNCDYTWYLAQTTTCGALNSTITGLTANTNYNIDVSVPISNDSAGVFNDYTSLSINTLYVMLNPDGSFGNLYYSNNGANYYNFYYVSHNTGTYITSINRTTSNTTVTWNSNNVSPDTVIYICINEGGTIYPYQTINSLGTLTFTTPGGGINTIPIFGEIHISQDTNHPTDPVLAEIYSPYDVFSDYKTFYSTYSLYLECLIVGTTYVTIVWNEISNVFSKNDIINLYIQQYSGYHVPVLIGSTHFSASTLKSLIPAETYPYTNVWKLFIQVDGKYNVNLQNYYFIIAPNPNSVST
jgi:hypothetical protein